MGLQKYYLINATVKIMFAGNVLAIKEKYQIAQYVAENMKKHI